MGEKHTVSLVTQADIQAAIANLQLGGFPVVVHSSLRSFGQVDGGPNAVIGALIALHSTLVVPTWSEMFTIRPPLSNRWHHNGYYDCDKVEQWPPSLDLDEPYKPSSRFINPDMGIISEAVLNRGDHVRGVHPLNSFSAVGPLAADIIRTQSCLNVYGPLMRSGELGGYVVLMGVGLDRMTLLHLAERTAGRNLFRKWARAQSGDILEVETGGCSDGFRNLSGVLSETERQIHVGDSLWRVFAISKAVGLASDAMLRAPAITHCDRRLCKRCDDAIAGGPKQLQTCGTD